MYVCMCMYVSTYVCIYVSMYLCIYVVCMYVRTYKLVLPLIAFDRNCDVKWFCVVVHNKHAHT